MSDCFDHAMDAYEDYDRFLDEGGGARVYRKFKYNHLFYHVRVDFLYIHQETPKALLLVLPTYKAVWVPKSICSDRRDNYVYVHAQTFAKCKPFKLVKAVKKVY